MIDFAITGRSLGWQSLAAKIFRTQAAFAAKIGANGPAPPQRPTKHLFSLKPV
jgi:hypothetical protein